MEKNIKLYTIICILSITLLSLCVYITYDKLNNKENNQIEFSENNNQNEIINTTNENFIEKFIGKYEYKPNIDSNISEEDIKKCSPNVDVTFDIAKLEINNNDTYTFNYGTNCGSGYRINGNYAINNNKIYLFNDECKITKTENNECVYPNCDALIILDYTEINKEISITYNHYSGNKLKLEKIK